MHVFYYLAFACFLKSVVVGAIVSSLNMISCPGFKQFCYFSGKERLHSKATTRARKTMKSHTGSKGVCLRKYVYDLSWKEQSKIWC